MTHSPEGNTEPKGSQNLHQAMSFASSDQNTFYRTDTCIHELFSRQAGRTPDSIAAVFGEQEFTYSELNQRSNQVAHYLRQLGVGPEVLVGLCVDRSLEMVVGLLGILKAGGAYLPLDPAYPPERLSFMIADGRVNLVLTQEQFRTELANQEVEVLALDSEWEKI